MPTALAASSPADVFSSDSLPRSRSGGGSPLKRQLSTTVMDIDPQRSHEAGPLAVLYHNAENDPARYRDDSPHRRLFGAEMDATDVSPSRSLLAAFQQSSTNAQRQSVAVNADAASTRPVASSNSSPAASLSSRHNNIASPRFATAGYRALNGASASPSRPRASPARQLPSTSRTSASAPFVVRSEPSWQVYRDPAPVASTSTAVFEAAVVDDIELDEEENADEQENMAPVAFPSPAARPAFVQTRSDTSGNVHRPAESVSVVDITPPASSPIAYTSRHSRQVTPPPGNPLLPYMTPGSAIEAAVRRSQAVINPNITPPSSNPLLPYMTPGSALDVAVRSRHEEGSAPRSRESKRRRTASFSSD